MPRVVALRHLHCEDLGSLHAGFIARGFTVDYVDAWRDDWPAAALANADVLAVLGGPIGANDEADYPFLRAELAVIERRLAADRPLLGICLGAQLIARALGARVYPGRAAEIGWTPLTLTEAGAVSPLRHLAAAHTNMLHWHGDTFDLPAGATRLASTPACANQAFAHGPHCLAFQCHPEAEVTALDAWLVAHASELAQHGLAPSELRRQNAAFAPTLARQAALCLGDWLDQRRP